MIEIVGWELLCSFISTGFALSMAYLVTISTLMSPLRARMEAHRDAGVFAAEFLSAVLSCKYCFGTYAYTIAFFLLAYRLIPLDQNILFWPRIEVSCLIALSGLGYFYVLCNFLAREK